MLDRRRRIVGGAWAAVLIVWAVSCTSNGQHAEPSPAPAPSSVRRTLGQQTMVAACITERTGAASRITPDLCTVELDGSRRIIRAGIDPDIGPALSSDRTRVAFIVGGWLRVINVDGSSQSPPLMRGSRPEWLPDGRVAVVAPEDRSIVAVEPDETHRTEILVDLGDLPTGVTATTTVDRFAVSPSNGMIVMTLFDRGAEADGSDDATSLALAESPGPAVRILEGPDQRAFVAPDFAPDGRTIAVAVDYDLYVYDLPTGGLRAVGPPQYQATSPTWSADGNKLAWSANAVGGPIGPAVLVVASEDQLPGFEPVVGNENDDLDRFPAFPDW